MEAKPIEYSARQKYADSRHEGPPNALPGLCHPIAPAHSGFNAGTQSTRRKQDCFFSAYYAYSAVKESGRVNYPALNSDLRIDSLSPIEIYAKEW